MSQTCPAPHSTHLESLAVLCKAAGEPLRLNILRVLSKNSYAVQELAQIFAMAQSGISHHLKVLSKAGLLSTRREANAIFYRRSLAHTGTVHAALLLQLDSQPVCPQLAQRIEAIHQERSAASQAFFQRMASSFSQQQELIAGLHQYRDSLTGLLDSLEFAADALAVEIGPGDGSFLPELAQRFCRVTALDNSPAMLEQARQQCLAQQLDNVELQLADALTTPLPATDCMVLNMVLHHLPAPASALEHLASALKPGASLILSELCAHDQHWVQQACGDLWLGFAQEELTQWAQQAGLKPGKSIYLGLKNGFQIQLRQFKRIAD